MRAYKVVDVFTSKPFLGNPVAVVLDAEGLDTEQMQAIARWTNLSDTTFLLPPGRPEADYRLRIFTPRNELPFAGHPTLGSAHAALDAGRVVSRGGLLTQECGVGLVTITVDGEGAERRLIFGLPSAKVTSLKPDQVAELEAVLGQSVIRDVTPAIINVGAVWVVAQLPNAESVLRLKPDLARSAEFERRLGATGISVFGKHGSGEAAIEVRSFAPSCGIDEDPVCGSGNGSIAVFRGRRGLLREGVTTYVAAQGRCLGRDGRVGIKVDANGRVSISGAAVTCVDGTLNC